MQLVQVREYAEKQVECERNRAKLLVVEAENERQAKELEEARQPQLSMLPKKLPQIPNLDIAAYMKPASEVGGDYYDVLPIETNGIASEKSFLLCVADVSGKDLPASLLMSNTQATLRALLGRVPTLVELASRTNELLHATTPSNKFVTAVLLELESAAGTIKYVNAGHGDCMLRRHASGEAERLEATGLPLGMMPPEMLEMVGKNYEERSLQLQTGDFLALYSDGVSEAYDEHENEWGDERLPACLRPVADAPAQKIVTEIFEEIDRFAGAAPQHDDITLLILRRET